jgi:uncharacterized protein YfaS (alpha-2-macroglobulin family)
MLAFIRAAATAALVACASVSAFAADKAFQRDDLADAAIKLEAELKEQAGAVTMPPAVLRREADRLLARGDAQGAVRTLSQLVTVAPDESGDWLHLGQAILQTATNDNRQRASLYERASTAAYLAYQRAEEGNAEAEGLALLSRAFALRQMYRPALDTLRMSLDLHDVADRRVTYEKMRAEHGFRLLDYSVDSDAASPRICFQFSENLPGKRTDFSPFVTVAGMDRPAITAEDRQLCVEGLQHGERYAVALRAGLPSTVNETLPKTADFNIYVRDRKPFVHFAGRAYVLPRNGQQGIPIVSVNTDKVKVRILRFGDRSLMDTVLGSNFQSNLWPYQFEQMAHETGISVWKGEMTTERRLNADVTTAFPVEQATGALKPGVYVMVAEPDGPPPDSSSEPLATQWFIVSDLGLASYSGNDGIHVFVQSLGPAAAQGGGWGRLLARSNEVLATRTTDAAGMVHFEAGLARGEGGLSPAMVVASGTDDDYAFLNLKGPAFDLSDRGVAGRAAARGLDAFVYAERGVYRTGETVHLTALLRNPQGKAATGVPLTLVVERPDGVEYRRTVVPDQGLGGRMLDLPLVNSAPTGTWQVKAFVDPKGSAVGQTTFLVEDYVPDRLEFTLAADAKNIREGVPAEITLDGRFLYGAPASALGLDGEVVVSAAKGRPGFDGYQFGTADEEIENTRQPLEDLPDTDAQGKATFEVNVEDLPETTRPLEAKLTIRMAEAGGRAVERSLTLPVQPAAPMIGVKPLFSGRSLGEGDMASFDIVMVSPEGTKLAHRGLHYELMRLNSQYQWYRQDGRWQYEAVKSTERVADGTVDAAADAPGRIALPVSLGRYRLDVSTDDPDGPTTSVTFDAGWYADASADTPDMLEIALDKSEYKPGDTMTVGVTARTAGKVTLVVIGDRMLATTTADVEAGTAKLQLTVGSDWGNGAYVIATLRRPLDEQAKRMPGRAIGVQWFAIDRKAHTLALDLHLPPLVRPDTTLALPIKVNGLAAGEQARLVVAAVDVGILNLTNYKPPAPDDYYLGQRRLSAELRDLYGQLIDGMQGTRGAIRSGGDAAGATISGTPPTQPPLALYSGIVTVGADGVAQVAFDIPAFAGTVRVMAIAWSGDKVGHASGDVIVRDPVVLTTTLPRFLLIGDRSNLRLDLDNVEGAAGDYKLAVSAEGPLAVAGDANPTLHLDARQRGGISLPVAATGVGIGAVAVRVTGPDGFDLDRSYTLAAKPATQILARRTVKPLAKGESLTLSGDLFADLVPGTGSVALSVGPSAAFDVAELLRALDRYPFGCSEQIASRAMPLLYVNELASEQQLAFDTALDQRIRDAIARLLARQGSNGSFGLWSAGGEDAWLDAYVTDFLTRAREKNFAVPDVAFKLALDRLRNFVANAADASKDGGRELAYALYVLARNGVAPVGDLRYLADARLDDVKTVIAKAQIAAALGMLGDKARAERVYAAALRAQPAQPQWSWGRVDYGSDLRDGAALVTLAAEGGAPAQTISEAVLRVEAARNVAPQTSTQENAWLVLAARALGKDPQATLRVAGEMRKGNYYRRLPAAALADHPLTVENTSDAPVQAVATVSGAPLVPEPAAEKGFKIERLYRTLDGDPADPAHARQNQRFVVVLKITEPKPQFARVMVADYLPAGFEIDNPKLVSSGDTGTLDWIKDAAEPVHSAFRDDRFEAAFERKAGDPSVFTVAYVVRAVSPGHYVLPQAYVEDMYRPDRFGRTATGAIDIVPAH